MKSSKQLSEIVTIIIFILQKKKLLHTSSESWGDSLWSHPAVDRPPPHICLSNRMQCYLPLKPAPCYLENLLELHSFSPLTMRAKRIHSSSANECQVSTFKWRPGGLVSVLKALLRWLDGKAGGWTAAWKLGLSVHTGRATIPSLFSFCLRSMACKRGWLNSSNGKGWSPSIERLEIKLLIDLAASQSLASSQDTVYV